VTPNLLLINELVALVWREIHGNFAAALPVPVRAASVRQHLAGMSASAH